MKVVRVEKIPGERVAYDLSIADTECYFVGETPVLAHNCSLRFVDGKFTQAVTRGDGTTGEDITRNVSIMQGVPGKLPTDWTGHVRGEIICTRSAHERHFPDGSNPRNTASGTAKRQSDPDKCRFLTFMAFKVVPDSGHMATKMAEMEWAKTQGFTVPHYITVNSLERIMEIYGKYQDKMRARLDYDIDGLVLEVNDLQKQDDLGETNGRPAGAIAFKFPHETKETILEDVVWQVGNTGRITPVAIFETVDLGGAKVSRASLATAKRFKELNLRRGSRILVARRNDVIPRVEANLDTISST